MFAYRRYLWQSRKQQMYWTVHRRTIRDGFLGGNRIWFIAGVLFHGGKRIRKLLAKEPETVAIAHLPPGHSLSIRTIDPKSEKSA